MPPRFIAVFLQIAAQGLAHGLFHISPVLLLLGIPLQYLFWSWFWNFPSQEDSILLIWKNWFKKGLFSIGSVDSFLSKYKIRYLFSLKL